ncbi:uncharacterized protein GIQ15_04768 [Arthroderma uncinatum]|uniref:uncharacterized protein n=1 Tax=Arthroderma uncinatum TaxID=74035 RepID=UPI00144AEDD0|nr:uncharacterized protein GIQ15_04768 [Arthroderma uncinatum]KAF3482009.1 hypothetical protein GIQ15_04768 [Arthroderma uncinatum]
MDQRLVKMTTGPQGLGVSFSNSERFLIGVLQDFRNSKPPGVAARLEIRFTGTPLCDKLRGLETGEVELTSTTLSCKRFRLELAGFFLSYGVRYIRRATAYGVDPIFHIDTASDEEPGEPPCVATARANIFGLNVTFCDFRALSSHYSVSHNTAHDHASRREATIDTIAYNVITETLEDLTGYGRHDIYHGIIRTPLPSYSTFQYDPFRIIRLTRLACDLQYKLALSTLRAMSDVNFHQDLLDMLMTAQYGQRQFGVEIMELLRCRDPLKGMWIIHRSGLYSPLFVSITLRRELELVYPHRRAYHCPFWPYTYDNVYGIVNCLMNEGSTRYNNVASYLDGIGPEDTWLTAAFSHLAQLRPMPTAPEERATILKAIIDSLEAINPDTKISCQLRLALSNLDDIQLCVDKVAKNQVRKPKTIGLPLRCWGRTWRFQVFYSMLAELAYQGANFETCTRVMRRYERFASYIDQQLLAFAVHMTPLLDRQSLWDLFRVDEEECVTTAILEAVVCWQLDHPGGSREAAIEWLSHTLLPISRDRTNSHSDLPIKLKRGER